MKNKNLIQFKKLKKTRTGFSIFLTFVMIIVAFTLISVGAVSFAFSLFKSKMIGEYRAFHDLAVIYDHGIESGDENIFDIIDSVGPDYIICDEDDNIIHQNGENTCTLEGGMSLFFDEKMIIYGDKEKNILIFDEDEDYVTVDFSGIIKELWSEAFVVGKTEQERAVEGDVDIRYNDHDEGSLNMTDDEMMNLTRELKSWNTGVISYPLWCELSVNGGEERFIGKLYINIDRSDAMIMVILAGSLEIMSVVALLIGIIRIIRNMIRQRKIINLYMTDPITGGNNWSYFIIKGEPFLRKNSNRSKSFAVIELVFIKYRTFCMCHSIAEGEELLEKIYQII